MQPVAFLSNGALSEKARDLVEFDCASVLQAVAGRRGQQPSVFLADPERYERNGRVLRDSEQPRLLAYSPDDKTLYANDGCNSCIHHLDVDLRGLDEPGLRALAAANKIPEELMTGIAALAAGNYPKAT